jgi:glycosyltransferase involved in cell wall biosynthesis
MKTLVNLVFVPKEPTGLANYSLSLLKYLSLPDSEVLSSRVYKNITNDFGIKGHCRRLLWTQLELPKIYRQKQANLIFSPIPEAPLFTKCRFVVTVHDLIPLRFPQWFSKAQIFYCRYYLRQVLHQADRIFCNSLTTAQDVRHFLDVPSQKLVITPLACDHEKFQFLDLPTSNYFLYIGRGNPHKNVDRLIRAFAQLSQAKNYELWLAGSFDRRYTPGLQQLALELGIQTQVKFLNYVPEQELSRLINRAIALVFPTLWEGFGLPVLEAMACGTPVITSNISALKEVAGEAAILVDPYATGEITAAMQDLLQDQELRLCLRDRGLARAKQFTWQQTATVTQAVLQSYN